MSRVDRLHEKATIRSMQSVQKYICPPCGYIYDPMLGDPDGGISAGTAFEDIPDDWICPVCGVAKSMFEPYEN